MAKGENMALRPVVVADIDPRLLSIMGALMPGKPGPDLSKAIGIAKDAAGLIVDQDTASSMIAQAVLAAATSAEGERRNAAHRRDGREANKQRAAKVAKMKALYDDLINEEADLIAGREKHGIDDDDDDLSRLSTAIEDIGKAISSLEDFVGHRAAVLADAGGNHRLFEGAFVRIVRDAWREITGDDPGVARVPVINFAVAIWTAFDLAEVNHRPLFDYLKERFENVG